MFRWWNETRAVHSKLLYDEIHSFIREGFEETSIRWDNESHRNSFIEVVEEFLYEKQEEGKIDQWKVMCDGRNNSLEEMQHERYVIDIEYRQKNCHSKTKLKYHIHKIR